MNRALLGQRSVVLVVEDESLVRSTARDMVEEAGFEAIAASDADEAIRILESRNDIPAVFTDVHMPGSMDGLRLARVVRNRCVLNSLSALARTTTSCTPRRDAASRTSRNWLSAAE